MPDFIEILVAAGVGVLVFSSFKKARKGVNSQKNETKEQAFARFKAAADKRVEAQRLEKPFVIMNLGSVKAPIKPHELEMIAMVMVLSIQHASMSRQQALEYAILTFVLSKSGSEAERKSAEETLQSAFAWEWNQVGKIGIAEAMKFKMICHIDLVSYFENGKSKNVANK